MQTRIYGWLIEVRRICKYAIDKIVRDLNFRDLRAVLFLTCLFNCLLDISIYRYVKFYEKLR